MLIDVLVRAAALNDSRADKGSKPKTRSKANNSNIRGRRAPTFPLQYLQCHVCVSWMRASMTDQRTRVDVERQPVHARILGVHAVHVWDQAATGSAATKSTRKE